MKKGVTKKEIVPHQPRKSVWSVILANAPVLQLLQAVPTNALVRRMMIIPVFCRYETSSTSPRAPQNSQLPCRPRRSLTRPPFAVRSVYRDRARPRGSRLRRGGGGAVEERRRVGEAPGGDEH